MEVPVLLAMLTLGCKVEPAPEDLDGLVTYLFDLSDDGTDEELAAAVVNLDAVVGGTAFTELQRGEVSRLGPSAADRAGLSADPADAGGVYLLDPLECRLSELEPILTSVNQDEIYEGVYEAYERTYTSDLAAFQAREESAVEWEVDYTSSALNVTYDARISERLRYVPDIDEELTPFGGFFLSRRLMTSPAVFTSGDGYYEQDYKVELYYEQQGGKLVHLHGMWRELEVATLTMDDDGMKNLLLNGMEDWDEVTVQTCAEGLP